MMDFGMQQVYSKYTEEDHNVWQLLSGRQMKVLQKRAAKAYIDGLEAVKFSPDLVPDYRDLNKNLGKASGWNIVVVKGLVENKPFFQCLKNKQFPASTWLRNMDQLAYLEEPDMFHDIFGHIPMLTDRDFCSFIEALSIVALKHIDNPWAVELISRIYWYTVEFGLIKEDDGLRIYGAGILSSGGESVYSLESDIPERVPFNIQEIMETPIIKDKFQAKYFIIDSYKDLYNAVGQISEAIEKNIATVQ
jgi:phenylalanine-4-hydroxylase